MSNLSQAIEAANSVQNEIATARGKSGGRYIVEPLLKRFYESVNKLSLSAVQLSSLVNYMYWNCLSIDVADIGVLIDGGAHDVRKTILPGPERGCSECNHPRKMLTRSHLVVERFVCAACHERKRLEVEKRRAEQRNRPENEAALRRMDEFRRRTNRIFAEIVDLCETDDQRWLMEWINEQTGLAD